MKPKMPDRILNAMFTVFYYMTFLAGALFIIKTNWSILTSLQVLEKVGALGGLLYLGDFFRREKK